MAVLDIQFMGLPSQGCATTQLSATPHTAQYPVLDVWVSGIENWVIADGCFPPACFWDSLATLVSQAGLCSSRRILAAVFQTAIICRLQEWRAPGEHGFFADPEGGASIIE
eukprot:229460-Pelagomonas_calceolata.AAC.1